METMVKIMLKSVLTLLIFLFISTPVLWGQGSATEKAGNIIQEIIDKKGAGKIQLTITGILGSSRLEEINVEEGDSENEFKIFLPDSVLDVELIPENILDYPISGVLDKIQISQGNQEGVSSLILTVKTLKKVQAEITQTERDGIVVDITPIEEETDGTKKAKGIVYRQPRILNLSILNVGGLPRRSFKLSAYLNRYKKTVIERNLGLRFQVISISDAAQWNQNQTVITYRKNYLKPALFLAKLIPGDQKIVPMVNPERNTSTQIEIRLGKDYQ